MVFTKIDYKSWFICFNAIHSKTFHPVNEYNSIEQKKSNLLSQSLHIRQTWLTRSLTLCCVSRVSFLFKKDTQNDLTKRFFYLCKQHKHDILCALPRYIIIYTKINNQPHLSQSLMARGSELISLSNINTLQNTLILIWCK